MLSESELLRRANMKRPDPVKSPARYRQWYYARRIVGLPTRVLARNVVARKP